MKFLAVTVSAAIVLIAAVGCAVTFAEEASRPVYDYELTSDEGLRQKVIKNYIGTGNVTRDGNKLTYTPYNHTTGEHYREHWTLSGNILDLKKNLRQGEASACRLIGTRTFIRENGLETNGIRACPWEIYYDLAIEKVAWIKSMQDIMAVSNTLNAMEGEARQKFEAKDYAAALPIYVRAEKIACDTIPQSLPLHRLREMIEVCKCHLSLARTVEFVGKFDFMKDSINASEFVPENFPHRSIRLGPTLRIDKAKYAGKRVRLKGILTFEPKPIANLTSELENCTLTAIDSIEEMGR